MKKNASPALQKAFGFTEDDLRMNRQGKLSPSQQKKLRQITFVVIAIVAVIVVPCQLAGIGLALAGNILIFGLLTALNLLILFVAFMIVQQREKDVSAGSISRLEGPIALHKVETEEVSEGGERRKSLDYRLTFSNQPAPPDFPLLHSFGISSNAYKVLQEGQVYRVYFTSKGREILSIEEL